MAFAYLLLSPIFFTSISAFQLATIIADHMVLPRAPLKATVWGTAASQSLITVTLDDGNTYHGRANDDGDWLVELEPQEAGTNRHMMISGEGHEMNLTDVAFGDVWLCGGQSNMRIQMMVTMDYQQREAERMNYPNMRVVAQNPSQCKVPQRNIRLDKDSGNPDCTVGVGAHYLWQSPASEEGFPRGFSAVCYNFGTKVYDELNGSVPIGLITFYKDGTPIQEFMSPEALKDTTCGGLHSQESQLISTRSWRLELGLVTGSLCYNGMIHPLLNMNPTGMVWYQGEQNRFEAEAYECMFPAFIQDLRGKFQREDMDFFYVQLAAHNMDRSPEERVLPWIRQAQQKALELPNVGFAAAIDQGDAIGGIHPKRKTEIGRRLAIRALHMHYGKDDSGMGPTAMHAERQHSDDVVITFEEGTAAGLHAVDAADCGKIGSKKCCDESPFEALLRVDQDSGKETWERIHNWDVTESTVTLKAVSAEATSIRFDWESYPQCVLLNGEGGPDDHQGIVAPPFRLNLEAVHANTPDVALPALRGVIPKRHL